MTYARRELARHFGVGPWFVDDSRLVVPQRLAIDGDGERRPADPGVIRVGRVGVIRVHGLIVSRFAQWGEWMGLAPLNLLRARLRRMAADDDVDTIVMDVNSPGGMVTELAETARLVADTTKAKTVVAVAAPYALSAAYWLASQAGRLVVAESGQVGSIGGYLIHEDISQMLENEGVNVTVIRSTPRKAEGMAVEPLTDEALEYFEGLVRRDHESFVHAVAIGRRVSVKIAGGEPFGAGRSVQGADAVSAGMADEVGDLESVVAGLVTGGGDRSGTRGGSRRRAHDRGRARLALAL